jgi:hypothetical protein
MAVSTLSFRSYISNLKGRKLGAFKVAAAKLGITFDDYVGRIERGEKCCIECRAWKDRGDFNPDSTRWDSLSARCRECSSKRSADNYEPIPIEDQSRHGPERKPCGDGDKQRARHLVNMDVASGKRPHPSELYCVKCGHKGGDKRHEYHHHMGYGSERVYDVVPLCCVCHHQEPDSKKGGANV